MNHTQQAVFLCRNESFHRWIEKRNHLLDGCIGEQQARDRLCKVCGITSRAELNTNPEAAAMFERIARAFARDE